MVDLEKMATEMRNAKTMALDEMTPLEIITIMNHEDEGVAKVVKRALPEVAKVIEWTTKSLQTGGRIVYIGAGTSGRLGILDASECPPTFGVSYDCVVGIIAGGKEAFIKAAEGAEDNPGLGRDDLIHIHLTSKDTVIGIAASGRTPYVLGAMAYAKETGCRTVAIVCNENMEMSRAADIGIELLTGPEILTGSTRLKAGTAEKMVLNMISTASMVGIGKVYENLMVDVQQTNEKLVCRAENIVMEAVNCSREDAKEALREADGDAKLAITRMLVNCNIARARKLLEAANGKIRLAVMNGKKETQCE
ncbi:MULTISPECIES: N-acetylmuramic acid 6-phosphate etherase [Robinsoniella]|uniref:N-acetylmuramic acid 6-phosphate etherase n=1 Tax=Robinsoniella TaxID=588605 RepID=UPI000649AC54|nr:N-acetylmuramic acid 6-phosphate etherase [Robinsoniella peoriensis]